jgi:hypothetical protein
MVNTCEHYWTPNGSYFCVHCGMDISKKDFQVLRIEENKY